MRKLSVFCAVLLVLGGLIGFIANQATEINVSEYNSKANTELNNEFADIDWQATLQKVDAYYEPPKKKNTLTEQQRIEIEKRNKPKPEPKPKVIEDAKLIGVVLGSSPEALLLLPKQSDTTRLKVGESWLTPWQLNEIKSDRIVWENTQTGAKKIQKLFK
ncbi:hypothetical protein BM527_16555 [Alteromonas sp. Mex14]|nr:hypothetical protein BM527_16555 [Alteromonas sp. Mex14]